MDMKISLDWVWAVIKLKINNTILHAHALCWYFTPYYNKKEPFCHLFLRDFEKSIGLTLVYSQYWKYLLLRYPLVDISVVCIYDSNLKYMMALITIVGWFTTVRPCKVISYSMLPHFIGRDHWIRGQDNPHSDNFVVLAWI
jgi:hypothetical protein